MAKRGAVLVLEDEAEIADWLAEFVADAGYTVIGPVASSLKAQELINERGIDAALLDITLKYGDQSLELAERLQAMRIPFAFVTAYSRSLLPVGFQEVPCIVKPFSQEDVVGILSKLLPASVRPT